MLKKKKEVGRTRRLVGGPSPRLMAFVEKRGWADVTILVEESSKVYIMELRIRSIKGDVLHGSYDWPNGNHRFEATWDPVKESGSLTVFWWE